MVSEEGARRGEREERGKEQKRGAGIKEEIVPV